MPEITPYSCADAFRRLDDFLDRELSAEELDQVRRHLEVCAVCSAEFRFEASVIRSVRSKLERLVAPPDLHARVWRSVNEARRAAIRPDE